MKVLNLQCVHQHVFEGWFASEDDFQSQLARSLVACPLCGDLGVQKLPSAPRLCLGGRHEAEEAAPTSEDVPPPRPEPASHDALSVSEQAVFLTALRHVVQNTQDVGERFATEVRRMHYGEAERRNIRGQVSVQEAVELLEEGIDVLPLPLPEALKETLQ